MREEKHDRRISVRVDRRLSIFRVVGPCRGVPRVHYGNLPFLSNASMKMYNRIWRSRVLPISTAISSYGAYPPSPSVVCVVIQLHPVHRSEIIIVAGTTSREAAVSRNPCHAFCDNREFKNYPLVLYDSSIESRFCLVSINRYLNVLYLKNIVDIYLADNIRIIWNTFFFWVIILTHEFVFTYGTFKKKKKTWDRNLKK